MSGFYPPGVTGNEPEIAGYPEGTYSAPACKGYLEDVRVQPLDLLDMLARVDTALGEGRLADARGLLARITHDASEMPTTTDVECGWEGKVDAVFVGGRRTYTVHWTCPQCGSEQEEDREHGDDHPDL